jgi:hypothetical protein
MNEFGDHKAPPFSPPLYKKDIVRVVEGARKIQLTAAMVLFELSSSFVASVARPKRLESHRAQQEDASLIKPCVVV